MVGATVKCWNVAATTDDGVCVVDFDHSPVNSLAPDTLAELTTTIRDLDDDPRVRVVVVTSASPKIFMAGADLKHMRANPCTLERVAERVDRAHAAFTRLQKLFKPTIGVVEGHALGGG